MSNLNGTFRSYFGAVAVPVLDKGDGTISNVTHDWANATAALGGGLAITILRLEIRNQRVDIAKQRLAEMAVANNCQFVFFLDDDVVCPPDTLMKMIKLWKSDPKYKIISGVYWSKSNPPMPLVFRGNLEGSYWDWTTQDLIKADGAGAGCLFVDTEVLKAMPKPWFNCNYFFEDPRSEYDLKRWDLVDQLGNELTRGKDADKKRVDALEEQIKGLGDTINKTVAGGFDPNLLKNKHSDGSTTEDLYFFKKAKEVLGVDLWVDCSIQCLHQDKRTGRTWGIGPDFPQAKPRYEGKMQPGKAVVLDIGAGEANYFVKEGTRIRVDLDPKTNPDVIADARFLPFEDCYADVVMSSHMLEHFSFKETVSVLKEWSRVLKVGGKMMIIVPNLKWASRRVLGLDPMDDEEAERSMFMYYSAQKGDLKEAHTDFHKAGFTAESLKGVLGRVPGLKVVKVTTSEGNYGNWEELEHKGDDLGYNIVAVVEKDYHDSAVSLKMPLDQQEHAKKFIGDKAVAVDVGDGMFEKKPSKVTTEARPEAKKSKKVQKKK